MILLDEVFKIGKFIKPHGIKGEIALSFSNDIFDRVDCNYLICLIDQIFVPFFVESYRFKGSETALFLLEDIDSEEKARFLSGKEVYFPRKYLEEDNAQADYSWNYFIGFEIVDKINGKLGVIEAVDDTTMNTLFLVTRDEDQLIIPATEDFITEIDDKQKVLYLSLPDGLI